MTHIEDVLREALASTPAPHTSVDPLGTLDRRVRKARRRIAAGGVVVVAGVVSAVVVPIAVLGGNGAPSSVGVANPPTPKPSVSNPPGVTTWWPSGAVDVADSAAPGAPSWVLVKGSNATFIAPVDPNGLEQRFAVPEPADYVAPGGGVEWIVGTDHTNNTVRVSAINNAADGVTSKIFSGSVVSAPAVVGESLYLLTSGDAGTVLQRYVLGSDGIDQSQPLAIDGATEIAVTETGHLWVRTDAHLVEVVVSPNQLTAGTSVGWGGDIYSRAGYVQPTDSLWSFDGDRLIDLTPMFLLQGSSVAQGYRLNVAGRPSGVTNGDDDSLYVAVAQASAYGKQAGLETGLAYYSAQDVHWEATAPTQTLQGVVATSLVADGHGGVDYVDDQGQLEHWDPQLSAAAR